MFAPSYLDHNATTPLDPAAWEAMLPWLATRFGNPSSRHEYGRAARAAVDEARQRVAAAVGAHPTEVIFTSGGSETNNLFLKGVADRFSPGTLAVSAVEHPCILRPAEQLRQRGWTLCKIDVDAEGQIDPERYAQVLLQKPRLVSVMLANNETGVIQDILPLAAAANRVGAIFHTDAVQALGRIPVDFRSLNAAGVRGMTISSHKIHGPKGAAALIVDKRVDLQPLIAGGGHERGLRSGTENVPAIVGFGVACQMAIERLAYLPSRLELLRRRLEEGLAQVGAIIFGQSARRLPNTTYFALADIDGETLVSILDRAGHAVASGAACSSANPGPSHVLAAMGVAPEVARGAVRVSLGQGNDERQIDEFLAALKKALVGLKQMTAVAV